MYCCYLSYSFRLWDCSEYWFVQQFKLLRRCHCVWEVYSLVLNIFDAREKKLRLYLLLSNCLKKNQTLSYSMVPNLENTCVRLLISSTNIKQFFLLHFLLIKAHPASLIHSPGKKTTAFTSLNNEMGLGKGKLWYNYTNVLLTAVAYVPILFLILLSSFVPSIFLPLLFSHWQLYLKSHYHRMVWVRSDFEIM